jgi:L-amino acid N-acyltransferase YncA
LTSEATLRDGTTVLIRPLTEADGPELRRGLEHLSPQSAYRRFLGTPPTLNGKVLHYLTAVDHINHEALGAIDPQTGHGIAVARYIRDPDNPTHAELAIAIADAFQHRGLGSTLLSALARRARANGITTLTGLVLADNTAMLHLFSHLGPTTHRPAGNGTVEVETDLATR